MDEAAVSWKRQLVGLTADIVAAYVAHNSVAGSDIPGLLVEVHATLAGLGTAPADRAAPPVERATPAQIRKSIRPDAIISFIDGKPYKTLKRHLASHGLDPDVYRRRYGLLGDYPMVAPNYAAHRSALARRAGFGNLRRKRS